MKVGIIWPQSFKSRLLSLYEISKFMFKYPLNDYLVSHLPFTHLVKYSDIAVSKLLQQRFTH